LQVGDLPLQEFVWVAEEEPKAKAGSGVGEKAEEGEGARHSGQAAQDQPRARMTQGV